MEIEQLEFEERKRRISMEEKINLEKPHIEKMKVGEERQITARQVSKKSVKLPKLELNKFEGSIFKWAEFWDAFESAIHSNKQLHDVEKFNYLKAQLKGIASEVISGLELTQENDNIAINLLKERYGKKQIMIKAHFTKLMNLPMATYKTTSLRTFYDTMEKHLRCLQSLGEDDNNTQTLTVLQSKRPRSVLLQLDRIKERTDEWTVKKFREVLHHYILTLETCDLQTKLFRVTETDKESSNVAPVVKAFTYDKGPRSFTSEALLSYENVKSRYERNCICCSNNYWNDECQQYPDIKSRKNKLKDRCLKCMKLDHKVRECKVQGNICVHCGEKDKHHHTLCPKKFNQHEDQKNDTSTLESNDDIQSGVIANRGKVIMQTALMTTQHSHNSSSFPYRKHKKLCHGRCGKFAKVKAF